MLGTQIPVGGSTTQGEQWPSAHPTVSIISADFLLCERGLSG